MKAEEGGPKGKSKKVRDGLMGNSGMLVAPGRGRPGAKKREDKWHHCLVSVSFFGFICSMDSIYSYLFL